MINHSKEIYTICDHCCSKEGRIIGIPFSIKPGESARKCFICHNIMTITNLTDEEGTIIDKGAKSNYKFHKEMRELKDNDPAEFNRRMEKLREEVYARDGDFLRELGWIIPEKYLPKPNYSRFDAEDDVVRCPKCGSASITTGPRGVAGFWGFIVASKTVNRCAKCGNMWKPR